MRERGVVAVELALVAVPLTLMVLATVDFARAMFVYDQLVKATRDGARYLSMFDPSVATEYPTTAARNRVLYGTSSPAVNASPIVPGLTLSMIKVCDSVDSTACPGETFSNVATGTGSISLVKVKIEGYRFSTIFPGASMLRALTFEPIATTMRQVF